MFLRGDDHRGWFGSRCRPPGHPGHKLSEKQPGTTGGVGEKKPTTMATGSAASGLFAPGSVTPPLSVIDGPPAASLLFTAVCRHLADAGGTRPWKTNKTRQISNLAFIFFTFPCKKHVGELERRTRVERCGPDETTTDGTDPASVVVTLALCPSLPHFPSLRRVNFNPRRTCLGPRRDSKRWSVTSIDRPLPSYPFINQWFSRGPRRSGPGRRSAKARARRHRPRRDSEQGGVFPRSPELIIHNWPFRKVFNCVCC